MPPGCTNHGPQTENEPTRSPDEPVTEYGSLNPTPFVQGYTNRHPAVPRKCWAGDPEDRTSFHPDQATWSEQNLPEILFEWRRGNCKNPDYEPQIRVDGAGIPVFHPKDTQKRTPLKIYRNVPRILSTEAEGWLLEAIMRQDSRITIKDLWAHMPANPNRKSLGALQMRTKRFREQYRLASWGRSEETSEWNRQVAEDLSEAQKAANTTRGLQPYTVTEVTRLRKEREGTVPQRSRNKRDREEADDESAGVQTKRAKVKVKEAGRDMHRLGLT